MSEVHRRLVPSPALLSLLAGVTSGLSCTGPADRTVSPDSVAVEPPAPVWVERLGQDTLALEQFRLEDGVLEGTLVLRSPVTRVVSYRARLGSGGWVLEMEGTASTPPANAAGPPPQSFSARLDGDSVRLVTAASGDTTRSVLPAPYGTLLTAPQLPAAPSAMRIAADRFLASDADTLQVGFVDPLAATTLPSRVYRRDLGTLVVTIFGGLPLLVRVDEEGRVQSFDGRETTFKVRTTPSRGLDLMAAADAFAQRDAAGQGFGAPSPPGSVSETVAGATIEIHYSRPAVRGRDVWGGILVPWDTVWRTGANAATTFSTDRDLVLGEGVGLPAGEYTLWSAFTPSQGTLIVNSETGQWGTDYDASRDFVRVPLEMERLPSPVERFTISIASTGDGGRLALAWADRVYSVPFQVR